LQIKKARLHGPNTRVFAWKQEKKLFFQNKLR
jgi:hypothetical protein